jgi:hypothetical protein
MQDFPSSKQRRQPFRHFKHERSESEGKVLFGHYDDFTH